MDPLQWMGAVSRETKAADKNRTIIHKWSTQLQSNSIKFLWSEKLRVKKQINH